MVLVPLRLHGGDRNVPIGDLFLVSLERGLHLPVEAVVLVLPVLGLLLLGSAALFSCLEFALELLEGSLVFAIRL